MNCNDFEAEKNCACRGQYKKRWKRWEGNSHSIYHKSFSSGEQIIPFKYFFSCFFFRLLLCWFFYIPLGLWFMMGKSSPPYLFNVNFTTQHITTTKGIVSSSKTGRIFLLSTVAAAALCEYSNTHDDVIRLVGKANKKARTDEKTEHHADPSAELFSLLLSSLSYPRCWLSYSLF